MWFKIRASTGSDGHQLEWPTDNGGHEADLSWFYTRDNNYCAVDAKYKFRFTRPMNSSKYTPYIPGMAYVDYDN